MKRVIIAGHGVYGCRDKFYKFIRAANCPVLLTWKSIGLLDENDPLYCGRPGMVGQACNKIIQECDYLLVLGAKMDLEQTAYQLDRLAPNAEKWVVDIDINELNKFPDSWIGIHRDVEQYLDNSEDYISFEYNPEWLAYCNGVNEADPVFNPDWWNESNPNYYCIIDELSRLAKNTDVIAPEMSTCAQALFQTWKVKEGQEFIYSGALGSMGSGIPGAIGAALATGRRVLCPVGDGGFMLNVQELEVIHRLNLPIKFFVLDNSGYGAIMNTQRAYFNGHFVGSNIESGLTLPDIENVSRSYGLSTFRLNKNIEVKWLLNEVMSNDNPSVTIMKIPDDFKLAKVVSKKMVDGKIKPGGFENV